MGGSRELFLFCLLLGLHQGLFTSTILNPQVVLGMDTSPGRLLVRPVLCSWVAKQELVTSELHWRTKNLSLQDCHSVC